MGARPGDLGGSGNDYPHGGAGTDTLEGGNGNDLLHGGADADTPKRPGRARHALWRDGRRYRPVGSLRGSNAFPGRRPELNPIEQVWGNVKAGELSSAPLIWQRCVLTGAPRLRGASGGSRTSPSPFSATSA